MFGYSSGLSRAERDAIKTSDTNLPTKHRILYISVNYEDPAKSAFVYPLLGAGLLVEATTWAKFAKYVDEWISEFEVMVFFNIPETLPTLNHLETVSAQDVVNALGKWATAGNKFIVFTRSQDISIFKKDIDGNNVENVSANTVMGMNITTGNGTTGSSRKPIVDISNGVLGTESLLNYTDVVFEAFNNRRLIPGSGEIPIIATSDGTNTDVLAVYKPNKYCAITSGGFAYDLNTVGEYRYADIGIIARHLLGNNTPVSLANDCIYGRKIAASGYDNDLSKEKSAVESIIKAYRNRPLEMGVVEERLGLTDAEKEEMAAWYRSRYRNLHICSHSTTHCSTGSDHIVTHTDEAYIIPTNRVVSLKYHEHVTITSVVINGITLEKKGFLDSVTASQYGYDEHGRLKFHQDNIGETVSVSYQRLKEHDEWLGSLDRLGKLGVLTNNALFLTGGEKSLSSFSYLLAKERNIVLCDHINPSHRTNYLLQEGIIDKMPFMAGNLYASQTGFRDWEGLIRNKGLSKDEILNTAAPAMIELVNRRHLPFVWYNHDFMFSETYVHSLWQSSNYHEDWKKTTYQETIDYASEALEDWLDLLDGQNVYWMTRSEYCSRYDYMNRYVQYHVESSGKRITLYVRNTGDKPIKGLTFRSSADIARVTSLPNTELTIDTQYTSDVFSFDLLAGQTLALEILLN